MGKPVKRRKVSTLEEITFDPNAREEFLTGFHKRKQQRILQAKEQTIRREREERIKERKRIREERKQELEAQLAAANARLTTVIGRGDISREGSASEIEADEDSEGVSDREQAERRKETFEADEYIDEGKYTTVTIEPVDITKHGAAPLDSLAPKGDFTTAHTTSIAKGSDRKGIDGSISTKGKAQRSKPREKKKFRYESAGERKKTRAKVKIKKSLHGMKRRSR